MFVYNNQKFICKNQYIATQTTDTAFTKLATKGKALNIPIAHGEGRFFADEETIKRLNENNQILFRYCDENGKVDTAFNPNGSVENIAGITNKTRNVFGMMPHPERCSDKELGNTDGRILFESLLQEISK
jgi:phosphoribosylformylglycinamidine synthase